jgi:hypothetical protein
VPTTLAGEQSCQPHHDRPVGNPQHCSVHLASKHRYLMALHDDLDCEVRVAATGESSELEDAAEDR